MINKKVDSKKLGELITNQSLDIINRKDKETMLFALRKMVEDLNKLELLFADIELSPEQNLRFRQYISNNKIRVRKVIWGITGSNMKELTEEEEE